MLFEVNL
jgi:hypothetical protein